MTSLLSCYGVVEVETILLIWDIFFFKRWSVLLSAALAVLEVLETQLLAETEADGVIEILRAPLSEMLWAEVDFRSVIFARISDPEKSGFSKEVSLWGSGRVGNSYLITDTGETPHFARQRT